MSLDFIKANDLEGMLQWDKETRRVLERQMQIKEDSITLAEAKKIFGEEKSYVTKRAVEQKALKVIVGLCKYKKPSELIIKDIEAKYNAMFTEGSIEFIDSLAQANGKAGAPINLLYYLFGVLSPKDNQALIKYVAGELQLDALDDITKDQLKTSGPDITPWDLAKIAAIYNLTDALELNLKLMSESGEVTREEILELIGIAGASESFSALAVLTQLIIEEGEDYDLFDACMDVLPKVIVSSKENGLTWKNSVPAVDFLKNAAGENILQMILSTGDMGLLMHFKSKYLKYDSLQKAAVRSTDENGRNSVHYAAAMKDPAFLAELLDLNGAKDALQVQSKYHLSPLQIALWSEDFSATSTAAKLLDAGAVPKDSISDKDMFEYIRDKLGKIEDIEQFPVLARMYKSMVEDPPIHEYVCTIRRPTEAELVQYEEKEKKEFAKIEAQVAWEKMFAARAHDERQESVFEGFGLGSTSDATGAERQRSEYEGFGAERQTSECEGFPDSDSDTGVSSEGDNSVFGGYSSGDDSGCEDGSNREMVRTSTNDAADDYTSMMMGSTVEYSEGHVVKIVGQVDTAS